MKRWCTIYCNGPGYNGINIDEVAGRLGDYIDSELARNLLDQAGNAPVSGIGAQEPSSAARRLDVILSSLAEHDPAITRAECFRINSLRLNKTDCEVVKLILMNPANSFVQTEILAFQGVHLHSENCIISFH